MAFTAWDPRSRYENPCSCGCTDPSACTCNKPSETVGCKECACCPPGQIEVKDESGKVTGCLTPNDYQGHMVTSYKCPDGFIKAVDADGNFVACLDISDYTAWLATQTP